MCYTADTNVSLVPFRHLKESFFLKNCSRQLQNPQVTNILFRQCLRIDPLIQTNIQLLVNFWLHQTLCRMCWKVFFKIFDIQLWEQPTLRSITLLSSLVSWLTVALPSWGQTQTHQPHTLHLWNIQYLFHTTFYTCPQRFALFKLTRTKYIQTFIFFKSAISMDNSPYR